jgi:hypothetical protein
MVRAYTRIFSDVAFANRLPSSLPSVPIAVGNKRVVRLAVGSEGRVTDLTVKQEETDVQVAFDVDLLKSKVPFPLFDQDILLATVAADTVSLYRVIPPMSAIAGQPVEFDEETIGYNYKNMDGTYTNNQQYLYLLITPAAAGGITNWKISVTVERDAAGQ